MRTRLMILALAAGVSLGGCAYGGLGLGSGYGSPYGYGNPYGSGISYSIGYGNGYSPYGYGYSPYGYGYSPYGYGMPYYGWYNDFYYPGTGYYVYDSNRQPRVWSDAEKAYWTQRLLQAQATNGITKVPNNSQMRAVWDEFHRRPSSSDTVFVPTSTQQTVRTQRVRSQNVSGDRASSLERRSQNRIERSERRAERSADRASLRSMSSSDTRSDRRSRKD